MKLLAFPVAASPDSLEFSLAQLEPLAPYTRRDLAHRNIPEPVIERAFPLYSLSAEPRYYGASLAGAAAAQYPALKDFFTPLPAALLGSLTALGGLSLPSGFVQKRASYLRSIGLLPDGDVPVAAFNTLLADVLAAYLGKPIPYEERIAPIRPKKRVEDQEKVEAVKKYTPLVKRIAYRMAQRVPSSVDVDDLIQEGAIGLFDAMEKYDPAKNNNFRKYAAIRIRGAMLDHLRLLDPVARSVRRVLDNVEKALGQLLNEGGDTSLPSVLARAGVDETDYTNAALSAPALVHLDDIGNPDSEQDIFETLQPEGIPPLTPEQAVHQHDIEDMVDEELQTLDERTREMVRLYYFDDVNMREIGERYGITESRICQVLTRAREALKQDIPRAIMKRVDA